MRARTEARRPALLTVLLGVAAVGGVVAAILVVGAPKSSGGVSETTVTVGRGVVQSTVTGSGSLEPASQLDLSFGTSGRVTQVAVHAGQHVSQGQLLATIDDSSQQIALEQARAQLTSAQASLSQAEAATTTQTTASAAATTTPSKGRTSTTQQQQQTQTQQSGESAAQKEANVASAQANVDSAELSVRQAEANVADTRLRAPEAATVAAVDGQVGDLVGSSSSNGSSSSGSGGGGGNAGSSSSSGFLTLAQLSAYRMSVSLSESDIGKVKVGQPATVTVDAANSEEFAGTVTSVSVLPSSSSSSGSSGSSSGAVSYPVTISLDQTGSKIKPGMSATAEIITGQASGIVVPNQALTGSTVTLVDNGTPTTQTVQTGVVGDSTTEVTSGLKVGDKVVVRAAAAATPGTATTGAGAGRLGFGGGGFGGGGFGGGGRFRGGGGLGGGAAAPAPPGGG